MPALDLPTERAEKERQGAVDAAHAPAMAAETTLELPEPSTVAGPADRAGGAGGAEKRPSSFLLRPRDAVSDAGIVLIHGGGWALGSPTASIGIARFVAAAARRPVLSVGYRLAPEHPHPAQLHDVAATVDAVMAGAVPGIAGAGLTVTGFSAGGHLALADTLARRDAGTPLPAGLVLFYPVMDLRCDSPSYRAFADGRHGLSRDRMRTFVQYLGAAPDDPTANLAQADLSGLPPLRLICGDSDVLLCDALALHARALDAGVDTSLEVLPGRTHGFTAHWHDDPLATDSIRRAFTPPGGPVRALP